MEEQSSCNVEGYYPPVGFLGKLITLIVGLLLLFIVAVAGMFLLALLSKGVHSLGNNIINSIADTMELSGDNIRVSEVLYTESGTDKLKITLEDFNTKERYVVTYDNYLADSDVYNALQELIPGDLIKHNSNLEYVIVSSAD